MAKSSVCQGTACATHPQPCIDMCDAAAYCKAIGRGLCTDAGWTNACSSNGAYEAGYGTSLVFGTCNDYTAGTTTTVPVASETGCQAPASSGFAGVFDMIGNVGEWVDNCSPSDGATDTCKPRGLSFGTGAAAPTCSQSTYAKRSAVNDNVGFRCCTP
jgi:formylglycine-generating enzyme required for sulfatase activity